MHIAAMQQAELSSEVRNTIIRRPSCRTVRRPLGPSLIVRIGCIRSTKAKASGHATATTDLEQPSVCVCDNVSSLQTHITAQNQASSFLSRRDPNLRDHSEASSRGRPMSLALLGEKPPPTLVVAYIE